jgi:hypothetical protein
MAPEKSLILEAWENTQINPSLIEDSPREMKFAQTLDDKGSLRNLIQIPLQDLISAKTIVILAFDAILMKRR